MNKKTKAVAVAVSIFMSMMGGQFAFSSDLDKGDINFFLGKIAKTQDQTKKEIGIQLLDRYLGGDTANVEGLKDAIRMTAPQEDIDKLEASGYTLDGALEALDILDKMSKNDREALIDAVEAGDLSAMKNIIHGSQTPPSQPSGGGGGGGGTSSVVSEVPVAEVPATVTPLPAPQPLASTVFKDVENHWAKDAIIFLNAKGIIKGQSEDRFNPDGKITRAEFTTLVVKLLDLQEKSTGEQLTFKDVKEDNWFYTMVKIGRQYDLIQGIGEDTFGPNQEITREQMMTILGKALKHVEIKPDIVKKPVNMDQFKDKDQVAPWALESISHAMELDIISGKGQDMLAPKDVATRAEAAQIIMKLYEFIHNAK